MINVKGGAQDRKRESYLDSAREAALAYKVCGWAPIPISYGSKGPVLDGWPNLRIHYDEIDRYFSDRCNIGVLLGDPSGGLVDVDIDCDEALTIADAFLPSATDFGRKSTPRSHRIYISPGCATTKFSDPLPPFGPDGKPDGMLVELRSTGAQTVFPPSVHPCGEQVEWTDVNGDLSQIPFIDPEALLRAVTHLAVGALLVRDGWTLEDAQSVLRGDR